jgi:hypothetical protein
MNFLGPKIGAVQMAPKYEMAIETAVMILTVFE